MEINPTTQTLQRPDVEINAAPRRDSSLVSDATFIPADTANFSENGLSVANFVEETRRSSEIRPEFVSEIRSQVIAGNYPPPFLINGLGRLIGNQIANEA